MKREEKREHLIKVAMKLFNRYGYHAAGVDRVIAESGVAKTTLYRHFETKEDLIVAVLQRIDEEYRKRLRSFVEEHAQDPDEKLLATFDYLESWFIKKSFYGCPFISAAAEYSDKRSPVFQEARQHKQFVIAYFEELAVSANYNNPLELAEKLNILHEGAIAIAHVTRDYKVAKKAKELAINFINAAKRE